MRSNARSTRTTLAVFAITAVAMLGLAGCSSPGSSAEEEEPTMSEEATPTEEAMEADPAADLVGPGCAAYAEAVPEGPGSVVGMSTDPVAVAASNNPMLTTLDGRGLRAAEPRRQPRRHAERRRVHGVRARRRGVREDRPGDDRGAEDRLRDADGRS